MKERDIEERETDGQTDGQRQRQTTDREQIYILRSLSGIYIFIYLLFIFNSKFNPLKRQNYDYRCCHYYCQA